MGKIKKLESYIKDFEHIILKNRLVILAGAVGILLVIWPFGKNRDTKEIKEESIESSVFVLSEYEEKLSTVLTEIEGVGRTKVMLTLDTDVETVYAADIERETEYSDELSKILQESEHKEYVRIRTDDSGEKPLITKTIYPRFLGAVVVCDGGDQPNIQLKVLRTISSLTGLTADRISVQKMR